MKKNKTTITVLVLIVGILFVRFFLVEATTDTYQQTTVGKGELQYGSQNDHSGMAKDYNQKFENAVNTNNDKTLDAELTSKEEQQSNDEVIINTDYIDPSYVAFSLDITNNIETLKVNDEIDIYYRDSVYTNELVVNNTKIVAIRDEEGEKQQESNENTKTITVALPRDIYYVLLQGKFINNSKYVAFKSSKKEPLSITKKEELITYITENSKFKVTN